MQLHCPECQNTIEADDVNLVKTIAKCKSCNNIFEFTQQLKEASLPVRYREEISIPQGIEVLKLQSELEIMIKWRRSAQYFTFFFAIFWNVFVFFFSLFVIATGDWFPIVFMVPFWLAGGWLFYYSISLMVNTTYITADDRKLTVIHKPINFLIQKDQYFGVDEIKQLFARRYKSGEVNDRPIYAYAVDLILKNGETVTLIKELHSPEYARFIEQEFENYLGIADVPVKEEFGF